MSGYVELHIDQGANFRNVINITDDITNTPINVYGYTAESQMRRSYYSANISANIICTFSNTANGELIMTMPAANTAALKAGRYVFDIKVTDRSNVVSRILEGIVTVNPSVTR